MMVKKTLPPICLICLPPPGPYSQYRVYTVQASARLCLVATPLASISDEYIQYVSVETLYRRVSVHVSPVSALCRHCQCHWRCRCQDWSSVKSARLRALVATDIRLTKTEWLWTLYHLGQNYRDTFLPS